MAALLLIGLLWMVLAPSPMAFANGQRRALADYHGADPTGVPADLGDANLIERGQYLARAADCQACHTANDGVPFAGGRAFVLSFGTMYSPNITPDVETGIGAYTDATFLQAIHQGIARDGRHLYPSMPYASYTYMTAADALAIRAYLFSLAPVHAPARPNTFAFPFNQRWLMGIWSLLFNPDRRFEVNADHSAQWNRGAYLTEVMAHCGECHTPRNLLQALNNRRKFTGATQGGWRAYNITTDRDSGVGSWSDLELAQYIAAGHSDGHGTAAGSMGEAVDASLSYLTPNDVAAIVTYLKTVPPLATRDLPTPRLAAAPESHRQGVPAGIDPRGKQIFEGACMSCHNWSGISSLTAYATLTGARAVNDPTATNVAQIVISGAQRRTPEGTVFMPAFGPAYSDTEIAAVANYVTTRFGAAPSSISAEDVAAFRRQGRL